MDTNLVIEVGKVAAELLPVLGILLLVGGLWGLRKLPANVVNILQTLRVEQLMAKAVRYGLNSVAGAAPGKTLTVDVAHPVLKAVLQYALERAPHLVRDFVGSPVDVAKMAFARLDLDESVSAPDFEKLVAEVLGIAPIPLPAPAVPVGAVAPAPA